MRSYVLHFLILLWLTADIYVSFLHMNGLQNQRLKTPRTSKHKDYSGNTKFEYKYYKRFAVTTEFLKYIIAQCCCFQTRYKAVYFICWCLEEDEHAFQLNFNVCPIGIEHDITRLNQRFLCSFLYFLFFYLVLQEWRTSITPLNCSWRLVQYDKAPSFHRGVFHLLNKHRYI